MFNFEDFTENAQEILNSVNDVLQIQTCSA